MKIKKNNILLKFIRLPQSEYYRPKDTCAFMEDILLTVLFSFFTLLFILITCLSIGIPALKILEVSNLINSSEIYNLININPTILEIMIQASLGLGIILSFSFVFYFTGYFVISLFKKLELKFNYFNFITKIKEKNCKPLIIED